MSVKKIVNILWQAAAYREQYPDRCIPSHMTFKRLVDSLRHKGKFPDGKHDWQKKTKYQKRRN